MISKDDIKYCAKLARIDLTSEEEERFYNQLSSILGYCEKLDELDLAGVEPIYQVTGQINVFREDVITNTDIHEDLLRNAPSREDDFIKVKKVL
ncbi:MAG TPA: Asp-tRNA(Asn)/Glu-tRNA(Gln) amidotransferase subunit GatC [Patescibacteria group bacterium]|nr:Asp-tRNA(Asn)/Glu-tRNA(Gln) amidotransferase subunit GatC [Patescibacteria group bacterium]